MVVKKKLNEEKENITCGLIMPISAIDSYSAEHWIEVKNILSDAIKNIDKYNVEVKLVSDSDEIGVIQKRIVQNIYNSDIIVCDVSAKNPNVMFELGMRLAFDKPTIIVKDDKTGYSFDTGIIEHLDYPHDLRFTKIIDFKNKLSKCVLATYEKSKTDSEHSTFLKNFGQFQVANLSESTVPADTMILTMLSDIQSEMASLRRRDNNINRKIKLPESIIVNYIENFSKQNNIDVKKLYKNKNFYFSAEHALDASTHYFSQEEFISELENVILKCTNRHEIEIPEIL